MTSESRYREAYVWIWLPGETEPVVAGVLARSDDQLVFNYGRSYLARADAIPIYEPELPLKAGVLPLLAGLSMPSCIRDAAPDAWGRRVIINRKLGRKGQQIDTAELDELTYLLESGSDRSGALDFQLSPTSYMPRVSAAASLDDLLQAVDKVEEGVPLDADLDQALFHGSSLGGARPKALIATEDKKYVAKFSSRDDIYSVVKAEYIAMRLAALVGIIVAPVRLVRAANRDVLLIERFDRKKVDVGWCRMALVSALTLFGLDELMARYASYEDLAAIVRHRFHAPRDTLRELFARLVFNVLCGNTDDHARNHAAFWDGRTLRLTPAYDICPQQRAGNEATQAMLVIGDKRLSKISVCLEAAPAFQLSADAAVTIVAHQVTIIHNQWKQVCDEASLSAIDRRLFWRRQFLNPFAFEGAPPDISALLGG
ncbi:type II toxin-antitoxin system HipA family toxin [Bradyrhizobium sp.]|uniref:type II toxin-antitoxin system HipA family toxin n=1 Tax=Bradyrhizobium sp. TaxID=376 RepID=UPI003C7822D5